ncbi:MAG: signal peptidase I [Nitrospirae bacterium]|nr:signal peptidase I [Nitrospirota bacterium]
MAKGKSKLREYIEAILTALILALLIRAFVIQAFKIPSGSMIPTLQIGDHILVNKFIYGVKIPFTEKRFLVIQQPKRGDIMVFSFPKNNEECKGFSKNIIKRFENVIESKSIASFFKTDCRDFIKRVIGVGGDEIVIKNKTVYVNGVAMSEPYTVHLPEPCPNMGPYTVPYGKFFVMGDNRDQSFDSRFWGYVDMDEVKGKALIIYWSWDKNGDLLKKVRWSRIGSLVH